MAVGCINMIEKPMDTSEDILDRVPSVLRRADLAVLAAKERPLRSVGVSGSLYSVLINLEVEPGLTGAELARIIGVTPQAIAPLVGKLIDRGLLERRAHSRHASVQELHLTETGRLELAAADRIMVHLDLHLRRSLGEESHDRLRSLLTEVIEHVRSWQPPEDRRP
jgi:DNA-binding MarR family transcriptional regulator